MKKDISVFFLLALPALLWWFLPGRIVDGTDIIFPLHPLINFLRGFFAWDNIYNTGSSIFSVQLNLAKTPIYFLFSLLQVLGFSIVTSNKLYYFLLAFLPMFTMYFFLRELIGNKYEERSYPALIGAIFYVFNLYYVQQIIDQAITLTYLFTPLILYFFLKAMKTGKVLRYSLFIGLISLFYTPVNPNSYAVGVILAVLFILFYGLTILKSGDKEALLQYLKIIFLSILFSLFSSAYWLVPYTFYLKTSVGSIQSLATDWLIGVSKNTSFSNVIRLIGAWDWFESWNHEPYVPYATIITGSRYLMWLAFIPAILAILGFVFSKKKIKFLFTGIALAGIVLSMGSHSPTGWVYQLFYDHLPFFWIFRSPWYKFGFFITFSYSVLICFLFSRFTFLLKKSIIPLIVIAVFILTSFPLFLGTRFIRPQDRHGNLAPLQVHIPDYVFKTADYLNNQKGSERVIMVPQIAWESTVYNWGYGNLFPPLYTLSKDRPIVFLPFDRQGPGIELLKNYKLATYNPGSTPSANFLAFLNAKYVIQQNDYWYYYFRATESAQFVENLLLQQKNLKKIQTFGKWEVYQNSAILPKIYATTNLFSIKSFDEAAYLDLAKNPAFVISESVADINLDQKSIPTITQVEQNSPTVYSLNVKSDSPFLLVFQEAYNPNWIIKGAVVKHFQVNSYANGYYFNKGGNYDISIYYNNQTIFNISRSITFIFLFVVAIFSSVKTKRILLK